MLLRRNVISAVGRPKDFTELPSMVSIRSHLGSSSLQHYDGDCSTEVQNYYLLSVLQKTFSRDLNGTSNLVNIDIVGLAYTCLFERPEVGAVPSSPPLVELQFSVRGPYFYRPTGIAPYSTCRELMPLVTSKLMTRTVWIALEKRDWGIGSELCPHNSCKPTATSFWRAGNIQPADVVENAHSRRESAVSIATFGTLSQCSALSLGYWPKLATFRSRGSSFTSHHKQDEKRDSLRSTSHPALTVI